MERINTGELAEQIEQLTDVEMSQKHIRQIKGYLAQASEAGEVPLLRFVVLTCPNYTSNGGIYTFEELGDGVPLLTKLHLEQIGPLLGVLDRQGVAVEAVVLMADVSAFDDVLVDKYANGDRAEFLRCCYGSLAAIEAEYSAHISSEYPSTQLTTSSFLTYFDPAFNPFEQLHNESVFFKVRSGYVERIKALASACQQSMNYRIANNVRNSREIFQKEYGERKLPSAEVMDERVVTTMAEYLTLGHLASRLPALTVIAIHEGINVGLLNDRNRIKLDPDKVQDEVNTPVLLLKKKVY